MREIHLLELLGLIAINCLQRKVYTTSRRCDVCQELYNKVVSELEKDGWDDVSIGDEQKLIELNPLITPIE